ncbi:Hsp33 family molecular chaperone HslO [Polynucleobacter sp. MG-5-Ahmo-C2]|jgi:molecular chaperone Hsp33|uniref:Hsp33 family molecular chaperone HslO n=1 Tax=Polynucleobacter sp. MG-5-Ahmo-C2 TaxID=2081051 RepID=UPI001BFDCCAA|nr:Hsp33 family molecular chaperone HslO [Polynucleobacter sp. MG-5-Ahmo-C2]QWD99308.1 Hsp33 family molecular chaperone HslO [Polynucleobacter sp. MG-5-Ahmo-C2]
MNELLVFVCDGAPVRGEIVSISTAWQAVLERRNDPPVVRRILGDFVGAATLLSASLKFDGTLIIQAQSKGPIQLLVVECKSDLSMRATVKLSVDPSEISPNATLGDLLDARNSGRLVITLDPSEREPGQPPYQGIVALQQHRGGQLTPVASAAEAIGLYMQNSEQLETRIWLTSNDSNIGGLLLQRMPDSGGHTHLDPQTAAEGWTRIQTLGETITDEELITLPPETILRRLFLEESTENGVRSFPPRKIRFSCRCSRNKVADVLRMLGEEEVQGILEEQGIVETICEFCAKPYRFDAVDCLQVFKTDLLSDATRPPSSGH